MRLYSVLFFFLSVVPAMAQNTVKKQGLLFLRSDHRAPLEGVFVEERLNIDSSLEYNMLLCDKNKNTGVLVPVFYLYRKDKAFEHKVRAARLFENSYSTEQNGDITGNINNNILSAVLPVQLTFLHSAIFEMDRAHDSEYNTPIIFKGKFILSKSIDKPSEWGLLDGLEIIEIPASTKSHK
jgi:hypothetical protein